MSRTIIAGFLVAFTPQLLHAATAQLLSGPMVGHTTPTSAVLWVETSQPAKIRVDYWVEPRIQYRRSLDSPMHRGSAEAETSPEAPHTGAIELEGLPAGWLVYYELHIDGQPVRAETIQAFSLMPPSFENRDGVSKPPDFSVAFVSCMYPARVPVQPIWREIAKYRPDALVLIGDNNYMPNAKGAYETSEAVVRYAMARYHRSLRDLPELKTLLAATPTYGIWDDHDYGPDNSDRTFRWKKLSLSLFKKYYPNPSAGLPGTPGIFSSFEIGDTEFFLLDDRYHRDPNQAEDRQTMLGAGQLAWLREKLLQSEATFKVLVNGGTMLVNRRGSGESWAHFGSERDEFVAWLFENNLTGVLFAAGDWHVGTLNRLHRPKDAYPLYELLSSNAGVRNAPLPQEDSQDHSDFHQFAGPEYAGFNFGLLSFYGSSGDRRVRMQIIDDSGKSRVDVTLNEKELTPRWTSLPARQ